MPIIPKNVVHKLIVWLGPGAAGTFAHAMDRLVATNMASKRAKDMCCSYLHIMENAAQHCQKIDDARCWCVLVQIWLQIDLIQQEGWSPGSGGGNGAVSTGRKARKAANAKATRKDAVKRNDVTTSDVGNPSQNRRLDQSPNQSLDQRRKVNWSQKSLWILRPMKLAVKFSARKDNVNRLIRGNKS